MAARALGGGSEKSGSDVYVHGVSGGLRGELLLPGEGGSMEAVSPNGQLRSGAQGGKKWAGMGKPSGGK